jgi:hypothetical protein
MNDHQDAPGTGPGVMAETLRVARERRRPVLRSAAVTCLAALLAGGAIVAGAFAASWGLLLEATRAAEAAIEGEDSYVAYADEWDDLVKVALVAYPLLLVVALALLAWLFTAQAVVVEHPDPAARGASLRELWRRSRPHLGAAFRVQLLTLACTGVPGLAGLAVLAAVQAELVPGVVWPTYHEPATVQFLLVGRILPVVIWTLGLVLVGRLSLATAIRVADGVPAARAMRRSWTLTRTARTRTAGLCLGCAAAVARVFTGLEWLGTYVAHGAGLLMLAATDDNVWITGILVIVTPVAVALVLVPLALAPAGVLLACWRARLAPRAAGPS